VPSADSIPGIIRIMETRRFGRTGLMVSPLGFGGAEIGTLGVTPGEASTLLNGLLDRGVDVIDTAAMYRESEGLIGQAIADRRDEFVLISKCGHTTEGIDAPAWSARLVEESVDRSLRALRTDRLDVMLLHSCDLETLRSGEALEALIRARDAGKVRFAGYSGDNDAVAWAAAQPDVAVIQTSINLCDQVNIDGALPVACEHDVGVMVKRPMANAAWRDPSDQRGHYATYADAYHTRLRRMGIDPVSLGVADEATSEAWAECALRFVLGQEGVHTAIVGTTNPDRISLNCRIAGEPPLDSEVDAAIREAFRVAAAEHADSEDDWSGRT